MKIFGYELTLRKARKKQKAKVKGYASRRWEQRSKDILIKMTKSGCTDAQIAKELDRTIPAVFSMRHKLRSNAQL